ncbi:hypothetical protein [Rhizohabitans arisaemae]|uniref:hypothetical protein n=1 Tax=Rhizohabitans arisaemae TaxID=2720610 RepID=UPI0024B1F241|nr:hypothetical protein [Rhizohabitans arisaemae]
MAEGSAVLTRDAAFAGAALCALGGIFLLSLLAPVAILVSPLIVAFLVKDLVKQNVDRISDAGAVAGGVAAAAMFTVPLTTFGVEGIHWTLLLTAAGLTVIPLAGKGAGRRNRRLNRKYRGRYLTSADFDDVAKVQLARVQDAIDGVLEDAAAFGDRSEAAEAAVVLPHREWQVAGALARQSTLRRQQAKARRNAAGDRVRALLKPQEQALAASVAATEEQIAAIERYAETVRRARSAQLEWEQCQEILARNPEYVELLAATVKDDLAAADLRSLSGQAELLKAAYDAQISETVRAGRRLTDSAQPVGPEV